MIIMSNTCYIKGTKTGTHEFDYLMLICIKLHITWIKLCIQFFNVFIFFLQFFIQPLLVSSMSDNAVFRNMNIGIKYTVAFELPQHGKSYIYDYNKPGRGGIKRGGNQGIKH